MILLLRSFAAKVWAVLILLVILVGLLLGVARVLLPLASEFRGEVEAAVADSLAAPVRIARFGVQLRGFTPQLVLHNLALLSPRSKQPILQFREARIELDPAAMLWSLEPRIGRITLYGGRLLLKRRSDGSLQLEGMTRDDDLAEGADGWKFFLAAGRLSLFDSEVYWENQVIGAAPVKFSKVNIDFINQGDRHQLELNATFGALGNFQVAADFFGNPAFPKTWRGDIYLKGEHLPPQHLFAARVPEGYQLESGLLDLELWSRWEASRPVKIDGKGQWRDLVIAAPVTEPAEPREKFSLDHLSGRVAWRRAPSGWRLDVWDFALARNGLAWPRSRAMLEAEFDAEQNWQFAGKADFLRLQDLLALAFLFPIEGQDNLEQVIRGAAPTADIHDLTWTAAVRPTQTPQWQLQGQLQDFRIKPLGRAPGVSGLQAQFRMTADDGQILLSSDGLRVEFLQLFRDPIELDLLQGQVVWRWNEKGDLELRSDQLVAENADLKTRSRLFVQLPADGASPFIDMQTDFAEGRGINTRFYLPVGVMSDKLVGWLDRAIVSGTVTSGGFLFRGRVEDFPFREHEGRFEVLFGTEHLILDYQNDWPRLEEVRAEVRFLNDSLDIVAGSSKLLDSEARNIHVHISPLSKAQTVNIKGRVYGPFADALRILRETPLAERQGRYVQGITAGGNSDVELDFAIPLRNSASWRLQGAIHWSGALLDLPAWDLTLKEIEGTLGFDLKGLRGKGIRAQTLGTEILLDVANTVAQRANRGMTQIKGRLPLTGRQLAKRYPHPLLEQLEGSTAWLLRLDIPHEDSVNKSLSVRLQLESDLVGMGIPLPSPFGKAASASRKLLIKTVLGAPQPARFDLSFGDDVSASLALDTVKGKLRKGEIRLGPGKPKMPPGDGLRLTGKLQQLDLDAWLDWIAQAPPIAAPESASVWQEIDIQITELAAEKFPLRDLRLQASRPDNNWEIQLNSDRITGHARVPTDWRRYPLTVDLTQLVLHSPEQESDHESSSKERGQEEEAIDPRRFPAMHLTVQDLRINDQSLGQLKVHSRAIASGLEFTDLQLAGDLLNLQGTGSWRFQQEPRSQIKLKATANALGDLLAAFGYSKVLAGAACELEAAMEWPQAPWQPALASLSGVLDFNVKKGRVLEVDPGVGRVFGLLSLNALQRRLTLDFSDMFTKGFSFDLMQGVFNVDQGNAFTSQLLIKAPSSEVTVSGRTGLLAQDYDQLVTVIPRVSSGVPVAGAIAGGPAVGAALLLAQQVLGRQFDTMSRIQYQVTGTWDDPLFTPLKATGAGFPGGGFPTDGRIPGATEAGGLLEQSE